MSNLKGYSECFSRTLHPCKTLKYKQSIWSHQVLSISLSSPLSVNQSVNCKIFFQVIKLKRISIIHFCVDTSDYENWLKWKLKREQSFSKEISYAASFPLSGGFWYLSNISGSARKHQISEHRSTKSSHFLTLHMKESESQTQTSAAQSPTFNGNRTGKSGSNVLRSVQL